GRLGRRGRRPRPGPSHPARGDGGGAVTPLGRVARALLGGAGVALVVGAVGFAAAEALAGPAVAPLGPGLVTVEVGIEHSRFSSDRLVVRQGTVVRFVVANGDPIAHELVVGDDEV